GEATAAALRERGVCPDFVPSRATGETLAAELPLEPADPVLLAVSALTGSRLQDDLAERGASVRRIDAYSTVPIPLDDERRRDIAESAAVTFTTSSTLRFLA